MTAAAVGMGDRRRSRRAARADANAVLRSKLSFGLRAVPSGVRVVMTKEAGIVLGDRPSIVEMELMTPAAGELRVGDAAELVSMPRGGVPRVLLVASGTGRPRRRDAAFGSARANGGSGVATRKYTSIMSASLGRPIATHSVDANEPAGPGRS